MNSVLLWIAGLLVILLGSLFAVPYFVDWNSYRGVFEAEASRILGREVRVGGDVDLRLLPAPYVSFRRLRIADSDTATGQAFLRAESFTMWLAVPPLLGGVVEAKQVELRKPVLRLQIGADGSGNWSQFRISRGALPFVPRDVALQSLKVTDGVILVQNPSGQDLARVEITDAEVTAPALEGPYRFRASVNAAGEPLDVRGSTGTPEPDGGIRLKTAVRALRSANSYSLELLLSGLLSRPRFEGQLTATFPRSKQAAGAGSEVTASAAPASPFELRSQIKADALGATLRDIALNFEQQGQPQLFTGTAEASWRGKVRFAANLGSHWLDLDKMAGAPGDANPLSTARRLATGFASFLPAGADVVARLVVDQANLGGDLVTGATLAIEHSEAGIRVQELRAALPGGARIDLSGKLLLKEAEGFDGNLLLRGGHLGRFLSWAARGSLLAAARSDRPFVMNSAVVFAPGKVDLQRVALDLGGSRLRGDLQYGWEGRRQLSLTLDAGRADLSEMLPGQLGPQLVSAILSLGPAAAGDATGALEGYRAALPVLSEADVRIRVRASSLSDGAQELRDLDAEVLVRDGNLAIPSLRVATPSGFRLEVEGEVRSMAAKPQGTLRGVLAAPDANAVQDAVVLLAPEDSEPPGAWVRMLAPMRLAFVTRFGASGGAAAEVIVDGTALGGRLAGTLLLDQGFSRWRDARLEANLAAEGSGAVRLVSQWLTDGPQSEPPSVDERTPTRLLAKAAGVPGKELAVIVTAGLGMGELSFKGRAIFDAAAAARFNGEAEVALPQASEAFALAGWSLPAGAEEMPLTGSATLSFDERGLHVSARSFKVGESTVRGELNLAGPWEGRTLEAKLRADTISLPRVAALFLASEGQANAAAPAAAAWAERPIDLSRFKRLSGRVLIEAGKASVGELELENLTLELGLEPGKLSMTKLEGRALGGIVSSSLELKQAATMVALSGTVGFWDVPLERLGRANAPVAGGKAQFAAQISGQGDSLGMILSTLAGKGELELKTARLERLAPGAFEAAADAFISGRIENTREAFGKALRTAVLSGHLPLGSRRVPFEIASGVVRLAAFSVDAGEVRATNETTIDLQELKVDSAWKLEPRPSRRLPAGKGPLPGISVIYVGPLLDFASIEPRIQSEALEREITVRRMEREVEALERIRREDEARAKAEAERLRALQAPPAAPQVIEVPFAVPGQSQAMPPSSPPTAPARPQPVQPSWPAELGRGDRS
jgi:uncharacterized protein involved in outer membrane biogenesis